MSDLGERVTKAATAPLGGAIQKRQNIANELKPITALVEEMLEIANRSYGVALRNDHGDERATCHLPLSSKTSAAGSCDRRKTQQQR